MKPEDLGKIGRDRSESSGGTADVVDVTVVIPSYQRSKELLETLGKIEECRPRPIEILIHLDGGWDFPIEEELRDFGIPFRIFREKANIGPGGGRDLLIRESRTEFIASFDDDSFPAHKDFFAKVIETFERAHDAAILGASITNSAYLHPQSESESKTQHAFSGCGVVYRKSTYLMTTGYVPLPLAYGMEEADVAMQLRCLGKPIWYSPALKVIHKQNREEKCWSEINAAAIMNQALLSFLRYPVILWPLGFLQWLRRFAWHVTNGRLAGLASGILGIPAHLWKYRKFRRPLPRALLWNDLKSRNSLRPKSKNAEAPDASDTAAPENRITYVQFTNPGAYPPLEHSSLLLANQGWDVTFLGTGGFGANDLEFSPHPRIRVFKRKFHPGGIRQKADYAIYCFWVLLHVLRNRPAWLYCSDHFSGLPGLLASWFGNQRIVYHEHDSPAPNSVVSIFLRQIFAKRDQLARKADVVILPNEERLQVFSARVRPRGKKYCVWNCPSREEVAPAKSETPGDGLRIVYHGTIVPDRIPLTFLEAMKLVDHRVELSLAGYVTVGHKDHLESIMATAKKLGLSDRVTYAGTIPERSDLLNHARKCDVGLSLMPMEGEGIGARQMLCASNKPFDYLSQGLPVLVSELPEWENLFVDSGMGLSCDPRKAESLATALRWFAENPAKRREMADRGRQKILDEWNYDEQFAPVMATLASPR